jgi:hypothetical protein
MEYGKGFNVGHKLWQIVVVGGNTRLKQGRLFFHTVKLIDSSCD